MALTYVLAAVSIAFFRIRIDLATPGGFAVLLSMAIVQMVNVEYELESNEHKAD